MKNRIVIALGAMGALALLAAAIGGGYWFAMQRMTAQMNAQAEAPAPAGKTPLYYHDPMYPQSKFDKPGKSPFMDMMLVPVYGDDGADTGSVKISSRVVQNLGIRIAEVAEGALDRKVEAVGTVVFDERAVVVVQAKVAGYIEKLLVRAPLDSVVKGQPLAEILAPEWVAAQEEFLALQRSPQANDALRQAARQRLLLLGMSEATVAAVAADGRARARITITAPAAGVIGELAIREGMSVAPGMLMFRINGLGTVWINADVPETQAAWIKPGMPSSATVPAWPGETFKSRVTAILPEVNTMTRTLKVRLEVANPAGKLKPGMYATVSLGAGAAREVLLVPNEAVIWTGKRTMVVVADTAQDGKQQFKPVDVEVGGESGGMTEISKGLARGMKVVLSGQFLIDSEASLKAAGDRLSEVPPQTHSGEGRVEKIGRDSLTISHGPIPGLQMGAMTMEFKAPPAAIAAGVKEGGMVSFQLKMNSKGEFELDQVKPKDAMAEKPAGMKP